MMRLYIFIFILLLVHNGSSQTYFNNVYNYNGYYTGGHTVIDDGSGFVGYGSTENDTITQTLFFYKLSYSGEIQIMKYYYEPEAFPYPGTIGGAMKQVEDGNYIFTYHLELEGEVISRLIKLNHTLDTLWTKYIQTEFEKTVLFNCNQTNDKGYILTGYVKTAPGELSDLLLIKTDSLGNEQWHQTYGDEWLEQGFDVVQTSDGGYLIGGIYYDYSYDQSMDALVIKTDSLGNEAWTNYYGNPQITDGHARIISGEEGIYYITTVYGEEVINPEARKARACIYKINNQGEILDLVKYGPTEGWNSQYSSKRYDSSSIIMTGTYWDDHHWNSYILKVNNDLDSIWMREYDYFENYNDLNFIVDIFPTLNGGIVTTGRASDNDSPYQMWMMSLDHWGCESPGCDTTVNIVDKEVNKPGMVSVFPNPVSTGTVTFKFSGLNLHNKVELRCFNIHGEEVHSERIYQHQGESLIDVKNWPKGMYLAIVYSNNKPVGKTKFMVR